MGNIATYSSHTQIGMFCIAALLVGGERVAKLYDKERGSSICIGPDFSMYSFVTQDKGGSEEGYTYTFKLPYSMDGIILNIPGIMYGEAYMSEFISTAELEPADEEVVTDEFAIELGES